MSLSPPVGSGASAVLERIAEITTRFDGPPSSSPLGSSAASMFGSALDDALSANGWSDGTALGAAVPAGITPGGATGEAIVEGSMRYLGVPYRWGGTDPTTGLDCSGFVQQAYEDNGIRLPRTSRQQATVGVEVPSLAEARPGDLVTFGNPVDHIGIYVGDNRMIVAPRTGDVVKVQKITRPITNIRRVVGPSGELLGTGATRFDRSVASMAAGSIPSRVTLAARLGTIDGAASSAAIDDTTPLPASVPFAALFEAAGARHGVSARLLAAVAKAESNFNPNALSRAGAQGLMQFMPATARGMGIDPSDPAQAIDGAARYLRTQMDRFGSVELALAAYNAGPGAVARAGGIPQNSETRAYVPKVLSIARGGSW